MTKDILYLGSQSAPRQQLLKDAGISFNTLEHTSDECLVEIPHEFSQHVLAIADDKMRSLKLPDPASIQDEHLFALTADTMIRTLKSKRVFGKPRDKNHAREMLLTMAQEPIEIMTGVCLEKFIKVEAAWEAECAEHWANATQAEFCVDEAWIDYFLEKSPGALYTCGAAAVEGSGFLFLKTINGSFSGAIGIPLFELRVQLQEMGFKF